MTADDETPARTQAALARLQATLCTLTSDVVARIDERCPYRAREDRCTFAGGCVNQRRERDGMQCGGDQQIRRAGR